MNKELMPLYVGFLAAGVTAIGWVITNYLTKNKEDRVRQLEATKKHLERQIEEFYGPLFNLEWVCSLLNRPHNVVWGHGNPKISGCRDRLPTNVPRI